jgi:hypothetical protein
MSSEWYYDEDYYHPDEPNVIVEEDDEWECEFGERCLVPHFIHPRSECYTVEMALAWEEEQRG